MNRKLIALFFTSVFIFSWQNAFSNGGPLDDIYDIKTGKHSFKNVESIRLINEKLDIKIIGDYAQYNIDYVLENMGNTATITYGFPIDFTGGYRAKADTVNIKEVAGSFQMKDSGKEIKCDSSIEKVPPEPNDEWTKWKLWYKAKIYFNAKEKKMLHIEYLIKSYNDDMIFTKSFKPRYSPRVMNYSFNGAKYWGDGKAERVAVNIDASALIEEGGSITSIEPKDYEKKGANIMRVYENIPINTIPRLSITYENKKAAFSEYVKKCLIPKEDIQSVAASSTLKDKDSGDKRYSAENMLDGTYSTAWAAWWDGTPEKTMLGGPNNVEYTAWEQKDGKTITIDIQLKRPYHITGIGILNGYLKNEKTYLENCRIISMIVGRTKTYSGYGTNGPDIVKIDDMYYKVENEKKDLPVKKYSDFDPKDPVSFVDWLANYGEGYEETKAIRLDIDAVIPGTKYDEVAVSELYILGWQNKENAEK